MHAIIHKFHKFLDQNMTSVTIQPIQLNFQLYDSYQINPGMELPQNNILSVAIAMQCDYHTVYQLRHTIINASLLPRPSYGRNSSVGSGYETI